MFQKLRNTRASKRQVVTAAREESRQRNNQRITSLLDKNTLSEKRRADGVYDNSERAASLCATCQKTTQDYIEDTMVLENHQGSDSGFFSQRTPSLRVIGLATDIVCLLVSFERRLACVVESNRAPSGALRGYIVSVRGKAGVIKSATPLECASVISDLCGRSSDIRQHLSRRHDGGRDILRIRISTANS
ncbi:hypothetical protein EVAR_41704_1 [Eumeta japonica]|uniref:Uncharacterized protein n=1 Tax=Eumeta variegata TaxID=151549 RepID=A0A4C1VS30_EUMVA|nr:hypothetical protein EVAR_41704_1 [Eumeta japonica]